MKKTKSRFQAYVDPMLFGECKNYCEHHGVSISTFIEQLLTDFFSDSRFDSTNDSSQDDLPNLVSGLQSQILELSDEVKHIKEIVYLSQALAQSTDVITKNQIESDVESDVESKKIENKLIPENCSRNTLLTIVAEFDEQGKLLGYFGRGGKIVSDKDQIQIYKRFDSAERAIAKILSHSPNKIFRILSSE